MSVKLGACRVSDDVKLAAKAGADIIVVDSMVAGTGASGEALLDHSGIPTVPAIVMAREALREMGLYGEVSLVASGGIRSGADMAKGPRPRRRRGRHRDWGADRSELQS